MMVTDYSPLPCNSCGIAVADEDHPICQSYVDVCLGGALAFGESFAEEFVRTTHSWSRFWLDDTPVSRHP